MHESNQKIILEYLWCMLKHKYRKQIMYIKYTYTHKHIQYNKIIFLTNKNEDENKTNVIILVKR